MPDSFEKFQRQFEEFVNEQSCELEAVRLIFQTFIFLNLKNHPKRDDALMTMNQLLQEAIDKRLETGGHDEDIRRRYEKVRQIVHHEIEILAGMVGAPTAPPGKKN